MTNFGIDWLLQYKKLSRSSTGHLHASVSSLDTHHITMEEKSAASCRTRSRASVSTTASAKAARAEAAMARVSQTFLERKQALKNAVEALALEEEVAKKEAAAAAMDEYRSISERGSSIHLAQAPADPMKRTLDYVAEQAARLQIRPVPSPPRSVPPTVHPVRTPQASQHRQPNPQLPLSQPFQPPASQFPQPPRSVQVVDLESAGLISQQKQDSSQSRDVLQYLARRDLIQGSLMRFSDQPRDYRAWRRSFRNSIAELNLSPGEEMDLLVKWLGKASAEHANRLRTAHLNYPERGLQEIWRRLESCYGSPEAIEDSLFNRISRFPRISRDYERLRELSDLLTELQAAKDDGDLPGLTLLDTARGLRPIVEKLPPPMQEQWTSYGAAYKRRNHVPFPPFFVFVAFVEQQAEDKNDPSFRLHTDNRPSLRPDPPTKMTNRREVSVHKTEISNTDSRRLCPIHQLHHPLRSCRAFRAKPLQERRQYLMDNKICFRCCSSTAHTARECTFKPRCTECGSERHHTALHPEAMPKPIPASITPSLGGEPNNVEVLCTQVCGDNLMDKSCSKICLVRVHPQGQKRRSIKMYAVMDEHSNKSLARPEFFELFGDHGPSSAYSLRTCAGVMERVGRRACGYQIESLDKRINLPLPTLIECMDVPDNRNEIPTPAAARHHPHLASIADQIPELDSEAPILLLLGRDVLELHKVRHQLNGPRNTPYAQKLDMGWVIVGNVCLGKTHRPSAVAAFFTNTLEKDRPTHFDPCPNVFRTKERFSFGVAHKENPQTPAIIHSLGSSVFQQTPEDDQLALSIEDKIFLQIMDEEVVKDHSSSWIAPLPLKPSRTRLPNNKAQAVSRLNSLTRQFKQKPQLQRDFFAFMDKIFGNQQAEIAPPLRPRDERWYLPMFGIYHPRKPSKIRVVFDSSAQYNGASLNNSLLTGPDLNNTLLGVLIRFRKEPVAVMADVEQMFFCFLVKREHRDLLRFLWYKDNDPEKEVIEYRMKVHVFGNSPSPAVATYCLRKSVEDGHLCDNPRVIRFVNRNFYVDDGLQSVKTATEAIALLEETRSALAKSNLRLHKIASNEREVLDAFPAEDRANDIKDLDLDESAIPMQRSLGLDWDPADDHFTFKVANEEKAFTRRGLLSTINSLYDPLGFVAPVVVQGKLILRELTTDNVDWDTPLPPLKKQLWTAWRDSLQELRNLRIPRTYTQGSPSTAPYRQLCLFSDASTKAIAAVAYLRVIHHDETCEVGFIMGKTKLTPLPETSVPRLELCAAVLAVELADRITSELDMQVNSTVFYTDSKVVLGYISNEHRRFYVYVSNRVARIRRSSTPEQWHYVPTDTNPADCGTRSVPAIHLPTTSWLSGPVFLSGIYTSSPEPDLYPLVEPDNDAEIRPVVSAFMSHSSTSSLGVRRFERFSSWTRLRRAVARLLHIIKSFHKDTTERVCKGWHYCSLLLSSDMLKQAAGVIIRSVQEDAYAEEFSCLKHDRRIPQESPLRKLDPFVDSGGLLRVGGRTRRAGLDESATHPIILPGKHHVATLLVRHYHESTHHQGRHFTEGAVRAAGLWIVGGKRCVSRIIHLCVPCRRLRGPTQLQKMADLPEDRLAMAPPFTNVGLDVFGPWQITARRTRGGVAHNKRWATLFTCLSTRAVHIEVLESLDTSSLINAMRRFFAIRGPAKILRSDQGTNFVGARKELEMDPRVDVASVGRHLADAGCTWLFNPPHAPHMGGAWERMIGVTKNILNAMLMRHDSARLTHEVLTTFMAEVSAIINSRPLAPVSTDPEDPTLITPATLLTQKIGEAPLPPGEFDSKDVSRRQWRHVQHLSETFWKRWKGQYLPLLQTRSKWTSNSPNIESGSVVILKDHDTKRNEWPVGRVTKVIPSKDGKVRQVEVKTCRNNHPKTFLRPITEIVLLLPPPASES